MKTINEIISIKNKYQQDNKLFEDSECQKMWRITQLLLRSWEIPFCKNNATQSHLQAFS